ncbi:unnamed protein product [Linum trigynum]|uniref:Transposase MuDR plant domain-containing protein n=1 Tax=Linum trigynum TaxID=586398 RepID=A0AAV2ERB0_9ROSI
MHYDGHVDSPNENVDAHNMKEGLVELKSDKDLLAVAQEVVTDKKFVELYLIKKAELESIRLEADGGDDDFDINDFEGGANNENLIIDNVIGEDCVTDCGDSDYLGSIHSSDDEDGSTRRRFPEFNLARDMENPQFFLGQVFSDLKIFREAIRSYSIKNKFPLRFVHSDRGRVQVCCDKNCKWDIWVSSSPEKKSVVVKSYNGIHDGCVLLSRHKWFTYKYIAKKYLLRFKIDPKWGNDSIVQNCEEDFHYTISRWTARRAQEYALELIRGNAEDQYAWLRDYCAEVYQTHPECTASLLLVKKDLQPDVGRSSSLMMVAS